MASAVGSSDDSDSDVESRPVRELKTLTFRNVGNSSARERREYFRNPIGRRNGSHQTFINERKRLVADLEGQTLRESKGGLLGHFLLTWCAPTLILAHPA